MILVWIAFSISTYILFKRSTGVSFKLTYTVLLLSLISESLSRILKVLDASKYITFQNNLIVYNTYEIITFPILFTLYYKLIISNKRRVIPFFLIAFILTCIIDGFFITDFSREYETYPFVIGSIGISISIVFYLAQILQDGSFEAIKENYFFWFSIGVLIYYLGNTPFYSIINFFSFGPKFVNVFYIIAKILAIAMYSLICLGLFRYKISNE